MAHAGTLQAWELGSLRYARLPSGTTLAEPPGPLWTLVLAGEIRLGVPSGEHVLAEGDAALVETRTAYRLTASRAFEESGLVHGDLRSVVPAHRLPSPLIVRGFGTRHDGIAALVGKCPLEYMCRPTLFAASYGNLIGAAMTQSWLDDQDRDGVPVPDEAVTAVVAAVTARPGEPWTVDRMAGLVHLSRSALGDRFRRALGRGPAQILRDVRMREARRLLDDPSRPVEYVASAVGYGSTAAFSRAFSAHHGIPPQSWRAASPARDAQHREQRARHRREPRAEHERGRHAVPVQERAS